MNKVAIVESVRTPFVKAGTAFSSLSTLDLSCAVVYGLVNKDTVKGLLSPADIEEIAFGTVLLDPRTPNLAREIVLRTELPKSIGAHFVSNNCITGLVAANYVAEAISNGRIKIGVAGGAESMSRPTLTLRAKGEAWFLKLARAKTLGQKLFALSQFKPRYLLPVPPSPKEPSTGLTMGQHCELTVQEMQISRAIQDQIAFRSHQTAAAATKNGYFKDELIELAGVTRDTLVRADTTLEKLAKLPPVFDRTEKGTLSAGNSSALTDGASAVLLMSEAEAKKRGAKILGYISAVEFAAVSPHEGLLMAPAVALPNLFKKTGLTVNEIDLFEIHEAFGGQVASNLSAWEKGWSKRPHLAPIGKIPEEKINVNGGSIALGHPFAATGGRLIGSLSRELQRRDAKRGVISVCAAGGMACAMLIER